MLLSNSAGTVASSNAFLTVAVPPPVAFEPFAPAMTSYTPGANLIGQTNSAGQRWTQAGPADPEPTIQAGSLAGTFAGLPEGALINASGRQFRISYLGNKVTITAT